MADLASQLWNPWLAYVLLGVAGVLTLAAGVPQLRGLPWARGGFGGTPDEDPRPFPLMAAACASAATIGGTVAAIHLGGPGALVWMWIGVVVGLGLHFSEGVLGARALGSDETPRIHLLGAPGVGSIIAPFFAVGVVAIMVVVAGLLSSSETIAVLGWLGGPGPTAAAILLAVAALPVVWWSGPRRIALTVVPFVVAAYALSAIVVALSDSLVLQLSLGDAINEAFGVEAVAGGTIGSGVAIAMFHGLAKASAVGAAGGIGIGALAGTRTDAPRKAGAITMVAALATSAILITATGLVVLGGGTKPKVVAANELVPLEFVRSRGLRPSQQVGQTIVLPEDTQLQPKEHYAVVLRSSPRGHPWAKLDGERNAVIMQAYEITEHTHTVAFRSINPEGAKQAAWDVRVEMDREVRESPGGVSFLKLTPKDPDLDLTKMISQLSLAPVPYVMLDDYHFVARVAEATSGDEALGAHLAMYEAPNAERPFNPKLHEFFRNGYRGPYPDDGQPRPPFTLVSAGDFLPEIGRVLTLRLTSTERGARAAAVTKSGGVESPPWRFLLQVSELVLRHNDDPAKDIHIAVTPRLDGSRIRYDVADKQFEDMRAVLQANPDVVGPYVVAPDQTFEVVVRSDARLPPELQGRRALVPLHELGEPAGPYTETLPYDPHPAELLEAGFSGPYLAQDGAVVVAARFDEGLGGFGRLLIAATMILLTVAAAGAWAELGGRAATALFGNVGVTLAKVATIAAIAGGAYATRAQLWSTSDAITGVLVLVSCLGLALLVGKVREGASAKR